MTILDAGDITPKQARALFDVALGEFLFFAECAQAVAYNHSGIISPVRLEGKQRTCGCESDAQLDIYAICCRRRSTSANAADSKLSHASTSSSAKSSLGSPLRTIASILASSYGRNSALCPDQVRRSR